MESWLTVREAAPVLHMSTQGLYAAIREQQLPAAAVLRIGRRIRIDPLALRNWFNRDNEAVLQERESDNGRRIS